MQCRTVSGSGSRPFVAACQQIHRSTAESTSRAESARLDVMDVRCSNALVETELRRAEPSY